MDRGCMVSIVFPARIIGIHFRFIGIAAMGFLGLADTNGGLRNDTYNGFWRFQLQSVVKILF